MQQDVYGRETDRKRSSRIRGRIFLQLSEFTAVTEKHLHHVTPRPLSLYFQSVFCTVAIFTRGLLELGAQTTSLSVCPATLRVRCGSNRAQTRRLSRSISSLCAARWKWESRPDGRCCVSKVFKRQMRWTTWTLLSVDVRDTLNRRQHSQRPLLSFVLFSVQLSACLFNTYVFNGTN